MNKSTLVLLIGTGITGACIFADVATYLTRDDASEAATPNATATLGKKISPLQGYADAWSSGLSNSAAMAKASVPSTANVSYQRTYNMNEGRTLRTKALTDPAALRALIQQYETEKDPAARKKLKLMLSTINKPEVIGLADQLVSSSNAEKRLDGLELIQHLRTNTPAVRDTVMQVLLTEQSPPVLVQAMLALQPAAVSQPEEQQIVSQLVSLSENPNAAVRRQSMLSLGLWDNSGQAIDRLKQAAADQAPEVRQAAQMALSNIHARLSRMKTS